MKNKIISVILSGGSGTRLWPLSRKSYPKQFLPLTNSNQSLLQNTAKRIQNHHHSLLFVGNHHHRFLMAEQLQAENIVADILLEPVARNTASAIALAAWQIKKTHGEKAIMLVMPSDHLISDSDSFYKDIESALQEVNNGMLLTFGIKPDHANTGYGYICTQENDTSKVIDIQHFVEKPDSETAEKYLEDSNYYWNSGIFIFKVDAILSEFSKYHPNINETCELAISKSYVDLDFIRVEEEIFANCENISIDYAIMEKSKKIKMVKASFDWCDLGSWNSMWDLANKDSNNNVQQGTIQEHPALLKDSTNTYVHSTHKQVVALGVDNLAIIDTPDVVFVANRDYLDDIKKLIDDLKQSHTKVLEENQTDFRPWGSFTSINRGQRHQVKHIMVKPGAQLSLQKHFHRSEHWVVVDGVARVTVGEKESLVHENESVYIPVGSVHRLENPGKIPLHLIEIQTGAYLGEDDIIRLNDVYGRKKHKN